jgi:hypothetical protein
VKVFSLRRSTADQSRFAVAAPRSRGVAERIGVGIAALLIMVATSLLYAQPDPGDGDDIFRPVPSDDGAATTSDNVDPAADASADMPAIEAPPEKPAVMTLENELLTDEREQELKVGLLENRYKSVLYAGELKESSKQILDELAEYSVYRLSMKKYRDNLSEVAEELFRDVHIAASLQDKPGLATGFRRYYLDQIVSRATDLLDGNFNVRMQAVAVLIRLNLLEENRKEGTAAVAFLPASEPLLQVLDDEEQLDGLKIPAVRGLGRIAATAEPDARRRVHIATSAIRELGEKQAHWGYQLRLVETLGKINQLDDPSATGRPFIIIVLSETLADKDRHWLVRCEAARSLGRARVNRDINLGLIAFEIAGLAREVADAYNRKPTVFPWRECFWKLYLAFKPENEEEFRTKAGLLNKVTSAPNRKLVEEAYAQVSPLTRFVFNKENVRKKIPKTELVKLDEWLAKSQPDDRSLAPGVAPIISSNLPSAGPEASERIVEVEPAPSR